jgi:transcriptional regulator with PAS, ATPase and Fis domain
MADAREGLLGRFQALLAEAARLGDQGLLLEMRQLLAAESQPGVDPAGVWQGILGRSPQMLAMRAVLTKFAGAAAPLLVYGESGTGKELVAKAIHALSPRAAQPFVAENCAAIPETLLESVLFGHKKGSFTGAIRDHPGHFVTADQGTLFLDEIGDMPLAMQVKLLRTLQEGEVRPVGGTSVRKVDVRLVAATNRDLATLVKKGTFREDLFYRLNVLQVTLPPLRARGDDVVLLARHFLAQAALKNGRVVTLSPEAEQKLAQAPWPGNVRQLQNEMQRVAALCEGEVAGVQDLASELR